MSWGNQLRLVYLNCGLGTYLHVGFVKAFVGPSAYGAIAVVGIPNYGTLKANAYHAGIKLALLDEEGQIIRLPRQVHPLSDSVHMSFVRGTA